jgi:hypothetical protein
LYRHNELESMELFVQDKRPIGYGTSDFLLCFWRVLCLKII